MLGVGEVVESGGEAEFGGGLRGGSGGDFLHGRMVRELGWRVEEVNW